MSIHNVGFVVHPTKSDPPRNLKRLINKAPRLRRVLEFLGPVLVERYLFPHLPTKLLRAGESTIVTSQHNGKQVKMYCWGVPFTPKLMISHDRAAVSRTVKAANALVKRYGVARVGLGAFTSIIGKPGNGVEVAERIHASAYDTHVVTGNSLTVATAFEGGLHVAKEVGYDPREMTVAIVGARGHIGYPLAYMFAQEVKHVLLVGRPGTDLMNERRRIGYYRCCQVELDEATKAADLIVTVTSAMENLDFKPWLLKPGAILNDPSRPRNVGHKVEAERDDVLVVEGSLIKLPGEATLNLDQDLPPGIVFACEAETIALEMQGYAHDFSVGDLDLGSIQDIYQIALQHGFKLAGYRSGDKPIDQARINQHRQFVMEAIKT